jgi:ankyrin repeat protein
MGCGNSKENVAVASKPITAPPAVILDSAAEATPGVKKEVNFKPIHSAIRWNKPLSEIEALLTSLEAVNCVDSNNGNCPIHIAAQNGHFETVQLLIKRGADLNVQNAKGNTPIHMAVGYDYYETAMLLIENKADPEIKNAAGFCARNGIDGDKTLGMAALVSAKTTDDVNHALELCEEQIDEVNKAGFVSAGLKTKKALGPDWTPAVQERFKEITLKLK